MALMDLRDVDRVFFNEREIREIHFQGSRVWQAPEAPAIPVGDPLVVLRADSAAAFSLDENYGVQALFNQVQGQSQYVFTQDTEALRPVVQGEEVTFDGTQYLVNAETGPIIRGGDFSLSAIVTPTDLTESGVFFSISDATTNARIVVQFLTNGRMRLSIRTMDNVDLSSGDFDLVPPIVAGQQYIITLVVKDGLATLWRDGLIVGRLGKDIVFDPSGYDAPGASATIGGLLINGNLQFPFIGRFSRLQVTEI